MDPANPYQNVYDVVEDWERVKRVIRETAEMPLLLENYSTSLVDSAESSCTIN